MKKSALLAVVAWLVGCSAHAMTLDPTTYTEAGDAGGFLAAQDIVGTGIRTIQGDIGGTDLTDAFRFHFGGGALTIQAQAIVPDVNSDTGSTLVDLPLALLGIHAAPTEPCAPTDPCRGTGLLDLATAGLAGLAWRRLRHDPDRPREGPRRPPRA